MTRAWMPDAKPRRNDEELLQAAIVQHLKLLASKRVIWFAVPNGEHRSKRTGARLKAQGVRKGVADLAFTLSGGRSAYMELKRPGGRLSPEQIAFQDQCLLIGAAHAVCSNIDSALAILVAWEVLPDTLEFAPAYAPQILP